MNLIADRDIYPELIGGQAWFGKITDTLAEWYVKPGTRYQMAEKWEHFLKDALPRADREQPGSRVFGEIIFSDEQEFEEFVDPIKIVAEKIWEDIQAHETGPKLLETQSNRVLF